MERKYPTAASTHSLLNRRHLPLCRVQALGFIASSVAIGFVFKGLLGWHSKRMEWKIDISASRRTPVASGENITEVACK